MSAIPSYSVKMFKTKSTNLVHKRKQNLSSFLKPNKYRTATHFNNRQKTSVEKAADTTQEKAILNEYLLRSKCYN